MEPLRPIPEKASAAPPQLDALFSAVYTPRPARTYSHKRGSSSRHSEALPQLKPQAPPRRIQTKLSAEFQSWGTTEVEYSHDVVPGDDDTPESQAWNHGEEYDKLGYGNSDVEAYQDTYAAPSLLESSDENEYESDGVESTSSRGSHSSQQFSNVTAASRGRSIRRRPFLIFNRTPKKSRGYKKLVPKPTINKSRYSPGDAFSDREARPRGLFQVTRRKAHFPAPAVGTLDLTQSPSPTSTQTKERRINRKRNKRVIDNSFLPPTPKKARHDRHQERDKKRRKDEDVPPTTLPGLSAPYGQPSSVILGELMSGKQTECVPQVTEVDTMNKPVGDVEAEAGGHISGSLNGLVSVSDREEDDSVCVEVSGLPHEADRKVHSSSQDQGCISDTPPPRSKSEQPNLPPGKLVGTGIRKPNRCFRRVKTT